MEWYRREISPSEILAESETNYLLTALNEEFSYGRGRAKQDERFTSEAVDKFDTSFGISMRVQSISVFYSAFFRSAGQRLGQT